MEQPMRQWIFLGLAVLLTASGARAEDSAEHLTGLELMVRPAVGSGGARSPVRLRPGRGATLGLDTGALLDGASPYGVGFVGQAFLGYRFHPLFSLGLRAGMRTSTADELADGSDDLARSAWDAGLYARGYPLALHDGVRRHLDPWLSVGIAYMRDRQELERPVATSGGGSVQADWTLDHHAIAVPLALGVDYRVHSMLSIGPSFEYTLATGKAACVDVGATGYTSIDYCTDSEPGKTFLEARSYGVWSVGLDVKLTVF
jgi:opacity protein-like surface antigen